MTRFDALAGRLPSPWRPDDDDVGLLVPLTSGDVLSVDGDNAPLPATIAAEGSRVVVSLPRTLRVRAVRLAPHVAAGAGYLLQLRTLRDGRTPVTPTAVAPVRGAVARLPGMFRAARFTVTLVRRSLGGVVLQTVADALDGVVEDAAAVQQAHWVTTADHAVTHPYVLRLRAAQGLPPLRPADPDDLALVEAFTALEALGRLAGLLGVAPYETPPAARETVEAFRRRVRRIVALYRGGLGTLEAITRMVEACLPELGGTAAARDRPFTVEEHAPVDRHLDAATAGPPDRLVGPLMRWTVDSDGVVPATPTLVVTGVEPVDGQTGPTTDPVVQLHTAGGTHVGLGVAWAGTVPPGQVLRVRPTAASWLGGDGLRVARRRPTTPTSTSVDPTAPGPWDAVTDGPPGTVAALCQTIDGALWAGVVDAGVGALWRHDGQAWTQVTTGLAPVSSLAGDGQTLLVGTAEGLAVGRLHPPGGGLLDLVAPGSGAAAVHDLAVLAPGRALAATDAGLRSVGADDPAGAPLGPTTADGVEPVVLAVHVDRHGVRWVGLDRGLVVHQPGLDHWYAYLGGDVAESIADWLRLLPGDDGRPVLPDPAEVYLPAVHAISKGADETLWLGTARGLARYLARPVAEDRLSFTTVLEAFPDLGDVAVHALATDPRGALWIGTERGLFRFRGRDLEQHQGGRWLRLGRPGSMADGRPRGAWRFDPATAGWQRWSGAAGRRFVPDSPPLLGDDEPPVRSVAWTTGGIADLLDGLADDGSFTTATPVDPATLTARWQPEPTRVVDGGIPAVPPVPPGTSVWRYLRREAPSDVEPPRRPAWTTEGRLLPPPEDAAAPLEARFDRPGPPARAFDDAVFPFPPAARVGLSWPSPQPLSVLVRLDRVAPDEAIDPGVLDRVWDGIQQVRPSGVAVALAVEEDLMRGVD